MYISLLIYVYLPLANKTVLVYAYFENISELQVTN